MLLRLSGRSRTEPDMHPDTLIPPLYIMSKARMITAGAGGTQYRVLTSLNQGGGSKKQGLVSTTNTRVDLASHIRIRGGGENRNWLFCMNQLGGVGRRWGQASGPGNRGGVSADCQRLAYRRRQQYPPKPCGSETRGWGVGVKYLPLCRPVLDVDTDPLDVCFWDSIQEPTFNCTTDGGCWQVTGEQPTTTCVQDKESEGKTLAREIYADTKERCETCLNPPRWTRCADAPLNSSGDKWTRNPVPWMTVAEWTSQYCPQGTNSPGCYLNLLPPVTGSPTGELSYIPRAVPLGACACKEMVADQSGCGCQCATSATCGLVPGSSAPCDCNFCTAIAGRDACINDLQTEGCDWYDAPGK